VGDRLIRVMDALYSRVVRPLFFAQPPDTAHVTTIRALALLDALPFVARELSNRTPQTPVIAGGVTLPSHVMVAAGLVKGRGFEDEKTAVKAAKGANIIPGWRSIPLMCGAVEFGSYTRYPRTGNSGVVMWRDPATRSTQNRVGLRNPGARAASEFLSKRRIPGVFGISIATSPGESDPMVQAQHVAEAIALFLECGVKPAWFTVNLSCPNTEDDPHAGQTAQLADSVCKAAVTAANGIPVWVKVGPDLSHEQYEALSEAFEKAGIHAVVATNTLAAPVPGTGVTAGVGGGKLYDRALATVLHFHALRERRGYSFDIVGCGGIMDGEGLRTYTDAGASAVQIWSALVYRGPFAARRINREFLTAEERQ
jgi:dihydroorotate dehydrogenase